MARASECERLLPVFLLEGLNGVNRQLSNGLKINRQPSNERAKISRQISGIFLNDRDRLTQMG